ncbi:hypothetical protein V3C99_017941 [Haemonchus contortus]|uniref:Reverse transcriptase n=1 Tax=Haemonchus contortus TaxID=6289 RepID=A0A7I4Z2B5_HAECO
MQKGIRISELCQRRKIWYKFNYVKKSKIECAGHDMRYSDDRWTRAVTDWIPWVINRFPRRPLTRWSAFFTKALSETTVKPLSLERGRFTGPLWLVTGTNGDVTDARSRNSTIHGMTGDTRDIITSPFARLTPGCPPLCVKLVFVSLKFRWSGTGEQKLEDYG